MKISSFKREIDFIAEFILQAISRFIAFLNPNLLQKTLNLKFFYFLFFIFFSQFYKAQCAMCRASLSNEANKAKAEAVNDGIVYLMIIPYILVGAIFYWIYRMKKNQKQKA